MKRSLRLSFYLRCSLGGYMMGTTTGFSVKIVEALAPQSCHQIPRKCLQYHVSIYSTHHRVTGSSHLLNGGLRGYYRGNLQWVPWGAECGPKILGYNRFRLAVNGWGTKHPVPENGPTTLG
jgi:hypothetical protein